MSKQSNTMEVGGPVVLMMAMAFGSPAIAEQGRRSSPSRSELANQVGRLVENLEQVRARRRDQAQAHDQQVNALNKQIERLEKDVHASEQQLATQSQAIKDQSATLSQARTRQEQFNSMLSHLRGKARITSRAMLGRVKQGITYHREARVQTLEEAAAQLKGDNSLNWARAVESLWRFTGNELKAANQVKLSNKPLRFNDGAHRDHAWLIRIGLVSEVFTTEDGQTTGVSASTSTSAWRLNLMPGEKSSIESAIRILREKAPPKLMTLAYPVPPIAQADRPAHDSPAQTSQAKAPLGKAKP